MHTAFRAERLFHFAAAVDRRTNLFVTVLTRNILNMTPRRLTCLRRRCNESKVVLISGFELLHVAAKHREPRMIKEVKHFEYQISP
jgi:hypothetical protein